MTESCRETPSSVNYVKVAGQTSNLSNVTAVQIINGSDQLQLFQTAGTDPQQRQIYAIIDPNSSTGQQLAMLASNSCNTPTALAVPIANNIDNASLLQVSWFSIAVLE